MTTEKPTTTRKPGRPRKYAEGRHQASVRFTPQRYAALKTAADDNRRSVSEEIEVRIERSFTDDVLADIKRGIDQVLGHLAATETADVANFSPSGMTSGPSAATEASDTANFIGRIQELEARIDELQREKALNEKAIEQAIERVITRAFARMGEVK